MQPLRMQLTHLTVGLSCHAHLPTLVSRKAHRRFLLLFYLHKDPVSDYCRVTPFGLFPLLTATDCMPGRNATSITAPFSHRQRALRLPAILTCSSNSQQSLHFTSTRAFQLPVLLRHGHLPSLATPRAISRFHASSHTFHSFNKFNY